MKIKYLVVALFSLGLVCVSCGEKKKGDNKEHTTEQKAEGAAHDDHGHDHGAHEGHDH